MDWSRQAELLPHYAAVVLLIAVLLFLVPGRSGPLGVVINVGVVVVVVLGYPPLVRWLELEPDAWEDR